MIQFQKINSSKCVTLKIYNFRKLILKSKICYLCPEQMISRNRLNIYSKTLECQYCAMIISRSWNIKLSTDVVWCWDSSLHNDRLIHNYKTYKHLLTQPNKTFVSYRECLCNRKDHFNERLICYMCVCMNVWQSPYKSLQAYERLVLNQWAIRSQL